METNRLDRNIEEWLENSKRYSVKPATYDRIVISKRLMDRYDISKATLEDLTADYIQRYINYLV